jgi:hypothetical protein
MSSRPRSSRAWDRGSDALGAALTFAVAAALFAWLGFLADGQLGTSPLFLILGLALGLVGGFLHLLRVLAPDLLPFGRPDRSAGREASAGGDRAAGDTGSSTRTPSSTRPSASTRPSSTGNPAIREPRTGPTPPSSPPPPSA